MILKRFENFRNVDNGEFIYQLIQADVITRETSRSTDFNDKISKERDNTILDQLLPMVNDFNQHDDLDFEDFWNKTKRNYNFSDNIKALNAEKALNKFFILKKKLKFNNNVKKSFFDMIGIPKKPKTDHQDLLLPDNSRDGSIVTGPDKDNVKIVVKDITKHDGGKQSY